MHRLVIENTKAKRSEKILQLNSMQSITSEEIADGANVSFCDGGDNLGFWKGALN
ncbi:MAG: hypothetical protein ACLTTJ_14145 [Blautia sp.]